MKWQHWYDMAHSKPFKIFNFHPVYIQQILEHILNPPINSCNSLVYDLLQFTHMSIYLYVWFTLFTRHVILFSWETKIQKSWSDSTMVTQLIHSCDANPNLLTASPVFLGVVFFFRFFSALKLPTLSTCLGKKTSDLGCDFLTPTFDN